MKSDIKSRRLEKAMRIFEALSGVDEELLERSEKGSAVEVSNLWRYSKVMAACFCLIVVGGLTWGASKVMVRHNASDQAMPENICEYGEELLNDVTGSAAVAEENGRQSSTTGGSGDSERGALARDMQEGSEEEKEVSGNEDPDAMEKELPRQEIASHPNIEQSGEGSSADEMKQGSENMQTEAAGIDSCSVMPDKREQVQEKEARATESLGSYIPTSVPDGYVFESARREQNPDTKEYVSMNVTWTKGMDSIFWSIRTVNPADIELADLSKTESYNVHLYDIPYAETVPEEYGEVFRNPVFSAADLSLEVIEMRMKAVQDVGDTDTPRGDFSVLYEDGILVRFNGDGSAQKIWEMFQSLKP